MEYRQLGNSGDDKDALAVIGRAIEVGINFLDDARYDDRTGAAPMKSGYSEVVFGRLLRRGGWNRSELFIANKLWYELYPEESPEAELERCDQDREAKILGHSQLAGGPDRRSRAGGHGRRPNPTLRRPVTLQPSPQVSSKR